LAIEQTFYFPNFQKRDGRRDLGPCAAWRTGGGEGRGRLRPLRVTATSYDGATAKAEPLPLPYPSRDDFVISRGIREREGLGD
jgi:hypothetical protein